MRILDLQNQITEQQETKSIRLNMYIQQIEKLASSLSSLALWLFGSKRNSLVSRKHSSIFSGETKSSATFIQD